MWVHVNTHDSERVWVYGLTEIDATQIGGSRFFVDVHFFNDGRTPGWCEIAPYRVKTGRRWWVANFWVLMIAESSVYTGHAFISHRH